MNHIASVILNITESQKATALLLSQDLSVKQIAQLRHLSPYVIEGDTKAIREKTGSSTIYGALIILIATDNIKEDDLINCATRHLKDKLLL